MKKTIFQILVLTFLLIMGCSKDELISDPSENNQLRKSYGINFINFIGNSIDDNNYIELTELADGSKISKNGKCSGTITGYGKINPTLSNYRFIGCDKVLNPDYPSSFREFEYNYILTGGGKVSLNTVDYFEFSFVKGLYIPVNYESGYAGLTDEFKGAMFQCNNSGQGEAKITVGSGKFKAFAGRPLYVTREIGIKSIDRLTGKINLSFELRN